MNRIKTQSEKVTETLIGKVGTEARRWKGMEAGYVAKHMWIRKYHGKATYCSNDSEHKANRYHWANISGEYLRDVSDYRPLCPSCNHKERFGNFCKKGHEYTEANTKLTKQGWRVCIACRRLAINNWQIAKRKSRKVNQ